MDNSEIIIASQNCNIIGTSYQYFSPYQPHGTVMPPE